MHEEYRWMTNEERRPWGTTAPESRVEVLGEWQAISREELMSDMFWQYGWTYENGRNHDDGFTIYLDDEEAQVLVYEHAAAVNELLG